MLENRDAKATIAVRDMKRAEQFYGGTLGLKEAGREHPGGITYQAGNAAVFVYESQFAGTNQGTALSWTVGDDVEQIVQDLKAKGIAFEHYDLPGVTVEGDVHTMEDLKAAWFKD